MVVSICLAIALVAEILFSRSKLQQAREENQASQTALADLQARYSLEQQEVAQRQDALFDHMVEGVVILDGQGRIRLVNAAMRELFGITVDVRGKRLIEAIRSHEIQEIVNEATDKGHVTGRDLVIAAAAETKYFAVNASSYEESEAEAGGIVILHDLTTFRQLESGRREFVANVSHELRTPLSMIKGYVETLIEGNVNDPSLQSRFLGKIQKHSDRLTYLIEDLLALSQLESNQIALSPADVPLQALVSRVFDDLQDKAEERGVSLSAAFEDDLSVWVDADRIIQVLQNLIENGIKYGRPEGQVLVRAKLGEDRFVVVTVFDDGPGIPAEARDRVFERFFRVDKARSREQGGTGLGLAIVKHIVQTHGGRVWLEQGDEQGTAFSFTLPAQSSVQCTEYS